MPERTGVLLLDKPVGPTSRALLDDMEERLLIGALGHAGTLDPLASGLVIGLSGRARRLQEFFIARDKTYVARVRFGETSPTLDGEGPVTPTGKIPADMPESAILELLHGFEGEILQTPPAFSALRVEGRRAHRIARHGKSVGLEPRRVTIHKIALLAIEDRDWVLEVDCGAGVYIRSLAGDLGEARGCGAYLAALRRTRSGSIRVEDAVAPADASIRDLRPLSEVLSGEPRIDVNKDEAGKLFVGNVIPARPAAGGPEPRFAWFGGRPCFKLTMPDSWSVGRPPASSAATPGWVCRRGPGR
jgi:tRNA pseudouridine55 synthase